MKRRVEAIHDVGQTDDEAELDDRRQLEVRGELCEQVIVDAFHARRRAGVTHYGALDIAVNVFGQRLVAQVGDLRFRKSDCPTEQHMGRHSVVARVLERGSQVRELAQIGGECVGEITGVGECAHRCEGRRMYGERASDVEPGCRADRFRRPVALGRRPRRRVGR